MSKINENDANEQEEMFITLTLDDDEEVNCQVITIFEAGDNDYIALLPVDSADDEESELFLYRYDEDENGEPLLSNIETDEEYEIVSDAFDELLDAEDFEGEDE